MTREQDELREIARHAQAQVDYMASKMAGGDNTQVRLASDKLIEAVAMGLWTHEHEGCSRFWHEHPELHKNYIKAARAIIAAIEESGTHVVVPVEPSDAMNDAATESVQAGTRTIAEYARNGLIEAGARLSPAIPYRAMLAARPKVLE